MKILGLILVSTFAISSYGQTIKATTEDGRKVILKSDSTWVMDNTQGTGELFCTVPAGFNEPKGDPSMKIVGASVEDLKNHVSLDNGCDVKDITLLQMSEQPGNGIYILCVCGVKMKYRKSGSVFFKDGEKR